MQKALSPDQLHVAVDLLIVTVREGRLNVLLAQRPEEPFRNCWALPGKLLALEESAEEAAQTLLAEMLPVQNAYVEQLFTFTNVNRDPRGRVISIAYLVALPWQQLQGCLAKPEVTLQCFSVCHHPDTLCLTMPDGSVLTQEQTAFDHSQLILTGIRRLQGKINYSDISFQLLQRKGQFSLRELQTIFEAILGEELDKSNFRRSILTRYETSGRIRQTEDLQKSGRGRPAVLYRYLP